jgi:hypothetical protein
MRMRSALLLLAGLLAASCSSNARTAKPAGAPPPQAATSVADIPELKPQAGEKVTAYDPSHSGKPNLWRYSIIVGEGQERVIRRERDLNGDGKIDMWEALDEEGNVAKVVYDLDFDGKPDLAVTYEKGQLVKKEYAPGFDGRTRSVAYYEGGKLVRKERDSKGTGKIDVWEYWENGELDRVGYDDDGDGQVDRWEKREGGEPTPAATDAAPAPAADKDKPKPK